MFEHTCHGYSTPEGPIMKGAAAVPPVHAAWNSELAWLPYDFQQDLLLKLQS